jgi:hypothetical protein
MAQLICVMCAYYMYTRYITLCSSACKAFRYVNSIVCGFSPYFVLEICTDSYRLYIYCDFTYVHHGQLVEYLESHALKTPVFFRWGGGGVFRNNLALIFSIYTSKLVPKK